MIDWPKKAWFAETSIYSFRTSCPFVFWTQQNSTIHTKISTRTVFTTRAIVIITTDTRAVVNKARTWLRVHELVTAVVR